MVRCCSPVPRTTIRIVGAASDPEATSALAVAAYVGGEAGSPGSEGPALGLTDGPGLGFAGEGFDFSFATTKAGWVPVCVYAVNTRIGHDTFHGCKQVFVVPPFAVPTQQQMSPATGVHPIVHDRHRHRHRRHHHRHHR